ncbi:MAG: OB-fold nucleic acid binding domain-containing protein [Actinomycetota bacterium]|nr:OB-fold nucleic acid binding domain-containing protein [Actinomycetota bacterium]
MATVPDPPRGLLRRTLHRLSADEHELEAEDLQDEVVSAGATAVASCPYRQDVCVAGTLRQVMLRPRAGTPTLEAELYDGSGSVRLVWLGRRRIAGIDPGRSLVAFGRVARTPSGDVIYNPRYELRAVGAAGG